MPDFIIIGAMKAATSTLHEQLARQPGIFMSSPKEPNFFSDDAEYARGVEWYGSLFAQAPQGALCGESSTHYTKLPTHPRTIERMKRALPDDVRFIYIMRHPIDRLISHYIHEWTQRVIDSPIDKALDEHPELIDYGRYAMQLKPHFEAWGRERVLPVFFDRLSGLPQQELERVCRFIGHEGAPAWQADVAEQNASSERLRQSAVRDAIVNLPGARAFRRALVPQAVRDRIKGLWMMKKRPQLSGPNKARLMAIFDDDLATLGRWLGLTLSCDNFKAVAREAVPQWKVAPAKAAVA